MKYKLLVLDLDGTLTNKQKKITPHTKETLFKIQEQGVKIVLASGRPTYGIAPLAEQLELQKYEGYILAYNGGEIIDWKTKELMYKNLLDHDVLPYLYECAKKNDFAIVTYDGEYVLTEKPDDEYVLKEALLNVMKIKKVDNFLDAVKHPIAKCLIGRTDSPGRAGKRDVRTSERPHGGFPLRALLPGTGSQGHRQGPVAGRTPEGNRTYP